MGLFHKSVKRAGSADNLPHYVDELLDAADLDSVAESDPLIVHPVEYGIEKAIQLLQKLPQENTELVVSVVRETLKSANIDLDVVVQDARSKAERMQDSIASLKGDIARLKTQIAQKEAEIIQTESALRETRRVQDLLQQPGQPGKGAVVTLTPVSR